MALSMGRTTMRQRGCAFVLTGLAALCHAGMAQAALAFSGPVTVSLIAPGGLTSDGGATVLSDPIDVSQAVLPGATISPETGGDIGGGFMLPSEFITLDGTSILLRVAQGSSDGTTGYLGTGGEHARYAFTGLNVAGEAISGLTFSAVDFGGGITGVDNLASLPDAIRLTSPHSVVLELDQLHFVDRGNGESNNFANFRIDLQTTPVPEPSASWLMLTGLAGLGLAVRRRSGG